MNQQNDKHKQITGGLLAALGYIATVAVNFLGDTGSIKGDYSDIVSIIVTALLAVWCVYIDYRIQLDKVRILTKTIFIVGAAWIFLRNLKRLMIFSPTVSRYLSYISSVPMLALAFLVFVLFFEIFFGNYPKKRKIYLAIGLFNVILFAMILTNDLHELFISYPYGKQYVEYFKINLLYYVTIYYCYGLLICAVLLYIIGTARRNNHVQLISPLIVSVGLLAYYLVYSFSNEVLIRIPILGDIVLVTVFFGAGLLEVCMQCGLIQNGGRYVEYLSKSMVAMCITDESGTIIYKTDSFNEKDYAERSNPDMVYNQKSISGGMVIICEDLSKINKLRRQAERQNAKLKRTNEVLARSREIKEEEAALKARKELYDEIESAVAIKIDEIEKLSRNLPDAINAKNRNDVKIGLAEIRLRIGYLKQKSMLLLLAKTDDCLPESQFRMIADVVKADVRSVGLFSVAFNVVCGKTVSFEFALAFNDFVEYIAENFAFSGAALFITVNSEKDCCVANIESEKNVELKKWQIKYSDAEYSVDYNKEGDEYRIVMKREVAL